jgi:hypothetical protein
VRSRKKRRRRARRRSPHHRRPENSPRAHPAPRPPAAMVKPSKNMGGKSTKKQLRAKGGVASRYTTRNAALNRLQLKLADFRRLCILKGIHPRSARSRGARCFPSLLLLRRVDASTRRVAPATNDDRRARRSPPPPPSFLPPPPTRDPSPPIPHHVLSRFQGTEKETQGPGEDVLPRQGHQLPRARAAPRQVPRAARVRAKDQEGQGAFSSRRSPYDRVQCHTGPRTTASAW